MRKEKNKEYKDTKFSNTDFTNAENIKRSTSLLVMTLAASTKTPCFYYMESITQLKKLKKECPFNKAPNYSFVMLNELADKELSVLKKNQSDKELMEQEDFAKLYTHPVDGDNSLKIINEFPWKRRSFINHLEITTWGGLQPHKLAGFGRGLKIGQEVLFWGFLIAACIVPAPVMPVGFLFLVAMGAALAVELTFVAAVFTFALTHEKIRHSNLKQLHNTVNNSHADIVAKVGDLDEKSINSVVTTYQSSFMKSYGTLLAFLTFGLVAKHQSKSSSDLLAVLSSKHTPLGIKKAEITEYVRAEKNYGKRLFCKLTEKLDVMPKPEAEAAFALV